MCASDDIMNIIRTAAQLPPADCCRQQQRVYSGRELWRVYSGGSSAAVRQLRDAAKS